ncbi:MAG: AmmeMemoRadiSam system protein B [Candidatus Omnitrophota bacterium]
MKKDIIIRNPCVAGQFYPQEKRILLKTLETLVKKDLNRERVWGVISPHAGYMYSGSIAGKVFAQIEIPEKIILIGPNHSGMGTSFSIMPKGKWLTPLGEVKIDEEIADTILKKSKYFKEDYLAHLYEHSLEVQLPFIQYVRDNFTFVPLIVQEASLDEYQEMGKELADILIPWQKKILVIASSDMTHYEPHEETKNKDKLAIDAILSLNETLLYNRIKQYKITMCGYAPCIIMLSMVKSWNAKHAELIGYQTSGDVTGDYASVVGYAGIVIK